MVEPKDSFTSGLFAEIAVTVPPDGFRPGCFLAVGLEGEHGAEGAYAVLDTGNGIIAAFDRAPGYLSNVWECVSRKADRYYTYYFALTPALCGKPLTVRILGLDDTRRDYGVSVHLCDAKLPAEGPVFEL